MNLTVKLKELERIIEVLKKYDEFEILQQRMVKIWKFNVALNPLVILGNPCINS